MKTLIERIPGLTKNQIRSLIGFLLTGLLFGRVGSPIITGKRFTTSEGPTKELVATSNRFALITISGRHRRHSQRKGEARKER